MFHLWRRDCRHRWIFSMSAGALAWRGRLGSTSPMKRSSRDNADYAVVESGRPRFAVVTKGRQHVALDRHTNSQSHVGGLL
jgi:hypothetical protein